LIFLSTHSIFRLGFLSKKIFNNNCNKNNSGAKMRLKLTLMFTFTSFISIIYAQFYRTDSPFAHTYSIVAFDPETGDMGVAVQSHWFSVGTVVSWGEGAV
jgi:hypothetical protein